jgi:V/A-type H+-transporting ATPase subunit I
LCEIGEEKESRKGGDIMIIKMKEILLFVSASQKEKSIQKLGEIGIVDVENMKSSQGENLVNTQQKVSDAEKAISILDNHKVVEIGEGRKPYQTDDPIRLINSIVSTEEWRNKLSASISEIKSKLQWYEAFGANVNEKDILLLEKKKIFLSYYLADKSALKKLSKDNKAIQIYKEVNGKFPVVLISFDEEEKLELQETIKPVESYSELAALLKRKERQLEEIDYFLSESLEQKELIEDYLTALEEKSEYFGALYGMKDVEGAISYIKGYLPKESEESFKKTATENGWGYMIKDPENEEETPVYIRNPKWVSIINPVLQFVGVTPGYKEVDVSIYFLFAFALFFAMLIGDAGYGAIFLLIAILTGKKLPKQMRYLTFVLSGGTVLWGVLTGTYFGAPEIAKIPFLSNLIIPEISSIDLNIPFMMHLSFIIGAIHLSVAHSINAFRVINSIKALSELGWILVVWGLFLVVELLVLGNEMPSWGQYVFIGGIVMIALFSKEDKNFVKSMLLSIANLPLSVINGFSDVVSYVRLFAVGMATGVVALSFNEMILSGAADFAVLDYVFASLALLLGHTLNIVLALMAVMVHGIRLNMLEFAGHLGIQFSGEEYKPFKLKNKITN